MAEYDFCTSLLTVAEYCVVPYRLNCQEKIENFEQFILDTIIQLIELTKEIAQLSSQIRAKYSAIKMIDALQMATAITENCSAFLTNDKQLQQIQEINCILIENLKG
ncbi:MAG: PIN domain-containing protein [Neisseriaceae bacterium]|nr:PIN domain-containing protein [Neisseriaceae bacterium]